MAEFTKVIVSFLHLGIMFFVSFSVCRESIRVG